MPDIDHILFYGTLCAGQEAHARFGLPAAVTFRGERTVAGTLYDLGEYPGLVLDGGAARAELYRIEDPSLLERLDAYEGYDARAAARSPFVRVGVRVARFAQSSTPFIDAWVYVYNGPIDGRPRILGTTWPEYRRTRAML